MVAVTEGLFDEIQLYRGDREHHACDMCLTGAWCSIDALRVRGWLVYDGKSQTGKELHVRICPACQRKGARS